MPDLSVIMTTYNETPGFLEKCLRSIISQTYRDFEFIIVIEPGDKNSDFLEETAKSDSRLKIIRNNEKLGISASRNAAINASSGRYIALIDGDDYCDSARFERQVRFLEANPGVSLVGSGLYMVDENDNITGERRYPELHRDIKRYFLLTMSIANPAVMVRKKDLLEAGLFDSCFSKAEDLELWLRFLAAGRKMHNLQEKLVYYRVLSDHSEKRGLLHWKNNYIARIKYSRFIWPLHERFFSLCFFFAVSHMPGIFLDSLLNLGLTGKLKRIVKY